MSLYKKAFYMQLQNFIQEILLYMKENKKKIKNYKKFKIKIKLYNKSIQLLNKVNSKYIIESFIEYINKIQKDEFVEYTIKDKILKNDINFFMNNDFSKDVENNDKFNMVELIACKELWSIFNKYQQDKFLKNLKMITILSDRYVSI